MQLWQIKREEKSVHITIRMQCIWRIVCVSPQLMSCVRSCTCYFSFVPSDMIYCIIQAGFVRSSQSEAGSAPDRAAAATSCSWHLHHPLTVAGIVCRHAKKRPHAGFIEKPTHSTLKRGFYGTETDFPPIETETNFLHHPVLSSSVMRHETRRWIFPCWSPLHVSSTFVLGSSQKSPNKRVFCLCVTFACGTSSCSHFPTCVLVESDRNKRKTVKAWDGNGHKSPLLPPRDKRAWTREDPRPCTSCLFTVRPTPNCLPWFLPPSLPPSPPDHWAKPAFQCEKSKRQNLKQHSWTKTRAVRWTWLQDFAEVCFTETSL